MSSQMDGGDQECSQHYRPDEPPHTQRRSRGDERKLNCVSGGWASWTSQRLSSLVVSVMFK